MDLESSHLIMSWAHAGAEDASIYAATARQHTGAAERGGTLGCAPQPGKSKQGKKSVERGGDRVTPRERDEDDAQGLSRDLAGIRVF